MPTLSTDPSASAYSPDTLPQPEPASARDRHALGWGVAATIVVALFGWFARIQILVNGWARPQAFNVFYRLYALYELPFLLLTFAAGVALIFALRGRGDGQPARIWNFDWVPLPTSRVVAVPAVAMFVAALLTTHLVFHGYALSMDEFSVDFQARIFAHGQIKAVVPPAWQALGAAIAPVLVGFHPGSGYWVSEYLPAYAALKAPFVRMGAGLLLNPLLAGISVLAMGAAGRRLWPGERLRPWLAIGLLVTSTEFILTSGSQYTMPAHLCLNLVWLVLYLRDDARSWVAAALVGAVALGLHHPISHAIFVTPFLVRLVRDKRWNRLAVIVPIYAVACVLWVSWLHFALPHAAAGAGGVPGVSGRILALPSAGMLWLQGIDISLLFTWQTPVFGLLVLAALLQSRRLPPVLQDLAWGVFLSLLFYTCRPSTHGLADQGHGWGDRYAYEVLGNLILLAAAGGLVMQRVLGSRRTAIVLGLSFATTLIVQVPIRLRNTANFVRPFAAAENYLRTRNADVVLLRADSVWYGRDLLRNDPYLRGQPTIVANNLSPAARSGLELAHPGRVVEVSNRDLLRLGLTPWANNH